MLLRRVARLSGAALLVLACAGCRADARVDITVRADGSGTLRTNLLLDADAVSRLGGASVLPATIPLSDLRRAGWDVSAWTARSSGAESLTLVHGFRGEADLAARLEDLVGPAGALRDPHIVRDRGWFASRTELSLLVDLASPSTGIASDRALVSRLRAAGVDVRVLDAEFRRELRGALHVTVAVRLPGGAVRTLDATTGTAAPFVASAREVNTDGIIKAGIAAALALLAVTFAIAASMSARRDRRRRRARLAGATRAARERAPLM